MVDSALARARARALGSKNNEAAAAAPREKAAPAPASVRTVKLQTGETVPEQYYDLDPGSQQRMLELIRERETKEKDDSAALNAVQQLLDLRDRDTARVKALEGQLAGRIGDRGAAEASGFDGPAGGTGEVRRPGGAAGGAGPDDHQPQCTSRGGPGSGPAPAGAGGRRSGAPATGGLAQAVDALRGSVKSTTTLMVSAAMPWWLQWPMQRTGKPVWGWPWPSWRARPMPLAT